MRHSRDIDDLRADVVFRTPGMRPDVPALPLFYGDFWGGSLRTFYELLADYEPFTKHYLTVFNSI